MAHDREFRMASRVHQARRCNTTARARSSQRVRTSNPRGLVGPRNVQEPYVPPEEWHEPSNEHNGYTIITRPPGAGYRHFVSEQQIKDRLATFPSRFIEPLEVVQLSQMTRKKRSFPCYGMQWGATIYLYPLEESLVETFYRPPCPALYNESRMYGGRWKKTAPGEWSLYWSERTIQDFYLNNILIHELGHLLDNRNSSYTDRERYAEWFAIEYGYRPSRRRRRGIRRRHHAV
ncbi:MAG: hypothetical protein JW829_10035 [Pirellulales bacterium]|nr:hypothetical protein [Pirellulales bacterium]